MSTLRAYLQLVRLPNVFTAIADVFAGYWLLVGKLTLTKELAALLLASACLYSAGIVLNDIRDIEIDRQERPNRPLPSGRISRAAALNLCLALAVIGIAIPCVLAGMRIVPACTLLTVFLLSISIPLYDLSAKFTPLGPAFMGLCRALNLYLGMSPHWAPSLTWPLLALLAFFLYVTSFSYFGRDEASVSARSRLLVGATGIGASILLLGFFAAPWMADDAFTLILWLVLIVHLGRLTLRAIRNPHPASIMYAMKNYILCIIVFDAVILSTGAPWPSVAVVLGLLVPTIFLGRFIYST